MNKAVFVSPFNGDWKVKTVGTQKAAAITDTKAEAVQKGIEIAKNNEAELIVQNMDGKIGWRNSYGKDPFPPRG